MSRSSSTFSILKVVKPSMAKQNQPDNNTKATMSKVFQPKHQIANYRMRANSDEPISNGYDSSNRLCVPGLAILNSGLNQQLVKKQIQTARHFETSSSEKIRQSA